MVALAPPPEAPPPEPLRAECVVAAAHEHEVPVAAVAGILAVEGGAVASAQRNTNGSWDMGPMQINTLWVPEIERRGISPYRVIFDGCTNVRVGAWILRTELERSDGDVWRALAHYHSRTPRHYRRYLRRLVERLRGGLRIDELVRRANRLLSGGEGGSP